MDAIELLMQQHREAEDLFERFEQADDPGQQQEFAQQVTTELRLHTTIEEELFYPALRAKGGELEEAVLEDLEEHHVVEVMLDELESMDVSDERYAAKFKVITELVTHHVEEEEQDQFPMVREQIDAATLDNLGEQMLRRYDELKAAAQASEVTKEDLYQQAKELGIERRSQMSKRELAEAVRSADG